MNSHHDYNIGQSNYAKKRIQPWFIWIKYSLDPFRADIIKRLLRTKQEPNLTEVEARLLDYQKIIHTNTEIIYQLQNGIHIYPTNAISVVHSLSNNYSYLLNFTKDDIIKEYNLNSIDSSILTLVLEESLRIDIGFDHLIQIHSEIIKCCEKRIEEVKLKNAL